MGADFVPAFDRDKGRSTNTSYDRRNNRAPVEFEPALRPRVGSPAWGLFGGSTRPGTFRARVEFRQARALIPLKCARRPPRWMLHCAGVRAGDQRAALPYPGLCARSQSLRKRLRRSHRLCPLARPPLRRYGRRMEQWGFGFRAPDREAQNVTRSRRELFQRDPEDCGRGSGGPMRRIREHRRLGPK
jgi:hypothetical protein